VTKGRVDRDVVTGKGLGCAVRYDKRFFLVEQGREIFRRRCLTEVVSGLVLVFFGLFVAQVALKTPAPRGLAACRGAGFASIGYFY
jgi:hypothetical protein